MAAFVVALWPSSPLRAKETVNNSDYQLIERQSIFENTQGEIEKLRIGVANIWKREYSDNNQVKKGLTAVLFISYKNDEAKSGNHVVFPGKIVTIAEYRIVVEEVKSNNSVTLEIWRKKNKGNN